MAILAPAVRVCRPLHREAAEHGLRLGEHLLFGRVPQSEQLLLSGISLAAIAWVAALIGMIVPDLGTFLLGVRPRVRTGSRRVGSGW